MGIFNFLQKKKEANIPNIPLPVSELPELSFPELPASTPERSPEGFPELESAPENFPELSEEISLPELPEIPEAPGILPDIEEFAEEKTSELPELKIIHTGKSKPLFINVASYRDLMEQLNNAKSVLTEYAGFSAKLNEIKISKDNSYEKWRNVLEAIERKLLYLDKIIFEGG